MGKKTKIGKQRKDRFYHLAKETGYRSRAAFKLLQLNRKHEFLQKSRVCVDLCAAPGGWLQVAVKHMPVSSVIIGVDLVPIRPIHNVITIQEDITSDRCRQLLKKELQTWKVDVMLNDGAPNVGQNWTQDAFLQAQLTLSALKLATEFLNKGGWFITKIFRSKDYNSLLWVFKQLFKKVFATKPQASRAESAEIFVVCQNYLAPDRIDSKFLDPKYAFADFETEDPTAKLDLAHPEKKKKQKALGYRTGDYTLFHPVNVSEFVRKGTHIELLNDCNELVFDDDEIANHLLTTAEVKECCKDIKVLGRKELKLLLAWRKRLRDSLNLNVKEAEIIKEAESEMEDEDAKIEKEIIDMKLEEAKKVKLKKKKVLKDRRKLRDKMNLKMVLPNDEPVIEQDVLLFGLRTIHDKKQLETVEENVVSSIDDVMADFEDRRFKAPKFKIVKFDRENHAPDDWDDDLRHKDETSDSDLDDEDVKGLETLMELKDDDELNGGGCELVGMPGEENPLVMDLENLSATEKTQKKVDMWFSKDSFAGLENDDEEDFQVDLLAKRLLQKKSKLANINAEETSNGESNALDDTTMDDKNAKEEDSSDEESDSDSDVSDGSDYDVNEVFHKRGTERRSKPTKREIHDAKKDGFEIVPATMSAKKRKMYSLDPEGLALGGLMIKTGKTKRDIMDLAWNRNTNNDDNLPDWFIKEERIHNKLNLPITKEMVEEYRLRLRAINARPIKKVVEAKARKKHKSMKKMERARKKAKSVVDSIDMTDNEKAHQIKAIYKKAGVGDTPKKELAYVVSKKGLVGKRVRRPPGVKGRFRVVDPRQKKDDRKRKDLEKMSKKSKTPKSKIKRMKKKLATASRLKKRPKRKGT